jgi:peptidoglycan DL-endopeptidase CwlO
MHEPAFFRSRRSLPVGLALLLALLVTVLPLLFSVVPARADPAAVSQAKQQAAALQEQVKQLNDRVEIAVEHYDKAADDLKKLDAAMNDNQAKLTVAEQQQKAMQTQLDERAARIYKNGEVDLLGMLLSVRSFSDFLNRVDLLARIGAQDSRLFGQAKNVREQVAGRSLELAASRLKQRQLLAQTGQTRATVQAMLAARQQALKGKEQQVAQLEKEEAQRQALLAAQAAAAQAAAARRLAEAQAAAARQAVVQRQAAALAAQANQRAAQTPHFASAAPPGGGPGTQSSAPSGSLVMVGSSKAAQALKIATRYLGVPYVWGGESPGGFDCSGLVQYVFAQVGINLPRVAADQQNVGAAVSRDALQPGDLVFFGNPAHHVGIYAGNGAMINAPYTGAVVRYDSIDRSAYAGARRVG